MKILKKIEKEDKIIIISTLILGLINFFYLLTHHVLSPDGLAYGPIYKSNGWELDLGRPLLLIIDRLRGGLVSPPIIMFLSLILISISITIIRRIFNIKNNTTLLLLTAIVVLFPTLSESALFIYCFDSYSLALLCSVLGLFFIKEEKPIPAIISIICSLSLYQAYISVTLSGVFALYIIELLNNKNNWKKFINNIIIIFLGLLSYFLLLKTGMFILGRQMASYKGANSFGIDTILSLPNSILNAYKDYFSFFFQENIIFNKYFLRHILNILIYISFFITIFFQRKNISKINIIFLVVTIILYPITTNIMDLIACTTTINLVTGIGFVMFYILFLSLIEKHTKYKPITVGSLILIGFLSYTYLLSNNGTFMAREDTYNHYYKESISVLLKAQQLDNYSKDLPWMFSDIYKYQSQLIKTSNGYLSKDYETYDNYYGIEETLIFFDHYLGERINIIDIDKYHEIGKTKEFEKMKLGEVKIIDSIIVVKNSEKIPF